jgi:hypothetical protein
MTKSFLLGFISSLPQLAWNTVLLPPIRKTRRVTFFDFLERKVQIRFLMVLSENTPTAHLPPHSCKLGKKSHPVPSPVQCLFCAPIPLVSSSSWDQSMENEGSSHEEARGAMVVACSLWGALGDSVPTDERADLLRRGGTVVDGVLASDTRTHSRKVGRVDVMVVVCSPYRKEAHRATASSPASAGTCPSVVVHGEPMEWLPQSRREAC